VVDLARVIASLKTVRDRKTLEKEYFQRVKYSRKKIKVEL